MRTDVLTSSSPGEVVVVVAVGEDVPDGGDDGVFGRDKRFYTTSRREFTTDEWIDLLIQSIGFNPELFGRRAKLIQLVRLIPFVERNYNLVELGPKGTGKSHIFSEFSPHGMLISGGEVTAPKLFVSNSNGRIGLVGYWDVVAFDEFAGKKKRTDKALVDIMKNYMANKSFSRGVETLGAEASMVFVGNTSRNVPYMLKHSDLFDELPENYHDSAYLDRLHFYIPGWEVDTIRGEMFSDGYGFVVDYIAGVLKSMRNADYSDRYQQHFTLGSDMSTRDRDGIHKTFSGLLKILYPHGQAAKDEIEEILRFSIEGRKRVKDQILRIDSTMAAVKFGYLDKSGEWHIVTTLEEDEYPTYYHQTRHGDSEGSEPPDGGAEAREVKQEASTEVAAPKPRPLFDGHHEFQENQRGVSYEKLLLPYLSGATEITITDPYIRQFHQARNLMELIEALATVKDPADEVKVLLVTSESTDGREKLQKQMELLLRVQQAAAVAGMTLDVKFDATSQPGIKGAHEKGGIEGDVGRFRRTWLSPMPVVDSLAELNEKVIAWDRVDEDRRIGSRLRTVGADFAVEQGSLAAMPVDDFDPGLQLIPRVDRSSLITVRMAKYSVPSRFIGRKVRVSLRASELVVFDGRTVIAEHPRVVARGSDSINLDHYLEVLQIKPGALPGSTALARARAAGVFTSAHEAFWAAARKVNGDSAGTRELIDVLLLHRSMPAEDVVSGLTAAVNIGAVTADVVAVEARRHHTEVGRASSGRPPVEHAPVVEHRVVSLTQRRLTDPAAVIAGLPADTRPAPSVAGYDDLLTLRRPVLDTAPATSRKETAS